VIRAVGTGATPLHHLISPLLLLVVQLQQLLLLLLQLLLLEAGLRSGIIRFEHRRVAARKCGSTLPAIGTSARMREVHGIAAGSTAGYRNDDAHTGTGAASSIHL